MSFYNLKSFLKKLREENEIIHIEKEVDPYLEVAEIHRRVIAANGPALLFKNVKGKNFPIVTNLFGTAKRVELAFGNEVEHTLRTAVNASQDLFPPTLKKLWSYRSLFKKALHVGTKSSSQLSSYEIPNADLSKLPAITSWIEDGGPFLTLPLVHTKGSHSENLGMYRIQIFSEKETGMHFQIGKGGGFHLYEAEQENKALPTNIYLGGPPALILSAIAPLPENVPEILLASLVMGDKLKRYKKKSFELPPLLDFEFCLQGKVLPHIRRPEGPFGDHYGYYSLIHDYPVFQIEKIFHSENAIYPATVVGKPRQEDFYIGDYLQNMLSPLFPLAMPQVEDLWSYGETGFHALTAAVIKERYTREAMSAAFRILGEGQLSLTKFLFGIDKKIDLKDFKTVLTHILERVQWEKDLYIFSELSMDSLDYAGPQINHGSKGVLLGLGKAVRKLEQDFQSNEIPNFIKAVGVFSPGCLVVEIPAYEEDKDIVKKVSQFDCFSKWPFIVAVDNLKKALHSEASFLWTTFTRFEPAADLHPKDVKLRRMHPSFTGPITLDARMKPWYPKELFCDPKTSKKVDNCWNDYFPKGNVQMGSSDYAHL